MKRFGVFWLSLVLILGLVSSLSFAQVPEDELVVGIDTSIIVDLDPARSYETATNLVIEQLYDGLVDYEGGEDAFKEVDPGLAESWEVSDDGLTWTFHLREDATFHSGNPVTAEDVVYSFTRALELDFAPIWMLDQFVPSPDNVEKVDEYTVAVTTNQPLPEGLMGAIFGVQGPCFVVDKELVEEHATDEDPWGYEWLQENSAGSGPFKLEEWSRNERVVFDAFEDYWDGAPKVNRMTMVSIPERTSQKFALDRGDIDIAWNLLPTQVEDYRDREGYNIVEQPVWQIDYVAMNMGAEPFDNTEVRKAVKYAINYEAIVEGIMDGAAVAGQTFVPVGMAGHSDEIMYETDVEKAKQLLEEAGYGDGFEVELLCQPTSPRKEIATQVQEDLAEIGIEVNIKQTVASQMYEVYRSQDHEMIVAGWGVDYADAQSLTMPFAHCRTASDEAEVKQLAWRNMAENPELTDLVESANKEMDEEKRLEMFKEIQHDVLDWGPFAITFYPVQQNVMKDTVKGYQLPPNPTYLEFENVYKE